MQEIKDQKANKGIILIKKANNLIESRYKFDIWETRIFLSILSQIRRNDEDFQVYRIWYRDVIKSFRLRSGDSYKHLRSAAQSLMSKSFFVNYEDNGVKREKQYHILREIDYLQEGQAEKGIENHEYVDVTVEIKMRPLLLQLQKNFTAYDLRNIVRLGVYPMRVYELLKQYEKIGKRTLEVNEMKKMFEVTEQYELFADFFRWIVKPAVKEINQHTDLMVTEVKKLKHGRKVMALHFTFQAKKEAEIRLAHGEVASEELDIGIINHPAEQDRVEETSSGQSNETEQDKRFKFFFVDIVERFGVTPSVFLNLLEQFSEAELEQAVSVTYRAKYNKQIKTNIAGFFILALKNGYTDPKVEAKKQAPREQSQNRKGKLEELNRLKAMSINDRIKEVVIEQPRITQEAILQIRDTQLARTIIQEKEKALNRSLALGDYREDRILRELVKGKIVELAPDRFADIITDFNQKVKALYSR